VKDYCYRKVKKQYKVFPSAYASGAIVQCRRRLGKNSRFSLEKKYGLHGWFMRGGGKGWVDCKTGKPCGRKKGEKRKYPACRPTLAMCNSAMKKKRGRKRISWIRKNPNFPSHYKSADDFQDYWISKGVDNGVNIYGGGKYLKPNRIVIVKSGRGMGLGTKFMEDLIRFADSKKLQIRLSPSSEYGASSVARLKDFYKRFGFVENAGRNKDFSISDTMYRPARNLIQENPRPPKAVSRVACRGLAKRRKYKRGGTAVGVARARDLCNRVNVSMRTVKRMSSYFARHRASRAENRRRIVDPVSPARIADELWGGTPGYRWVKKVLG